mgnify:FL=1
MNRTVIALGFFDGVHRGHGALLEMTVRRARELDAALDNLDAEGAPALALRKALRERVGELAEMFDGNFAVKQYRKEARS